MDKLDMFQAISRKVDEFGWLDMEIIQTDIGTKLISIEFQEGLYVCGLKLAFTAPYHKEMDGKFEVTWKNCKLSNIQLGCTHRFLKNIYILH